MTCLLSEKPHGSDVDITVLACSKGAEVYSIVWKIRSTRPDLNLVVRAVDISREILEFAQSGTYSLDSHDSSGHSESVCPVTWGDVAWNTGRDQIASIFERMSDEEVKAMFEVEGDQARVRSALKEGITWLCGDAGDPGIIRALGSQDIVVANRFLCHMKPAAAERSLRNLARLVKPGGYLFVSGVDLDVRAKVAREMGWKPVIDRLRDIHEGDASLRNGWPLNYWALEPFCDDRADWRIRYASVFRLGETPDSCSSPVQDRAPDSVGILNAVD